MTAGGSITITKAMLKPSGQTQTTLDRDPKSHGGVNVADLYTNLNTAGYLKMPSVGSQYQFVALRNWWTTNWTWTLGGGYLWFQPNYHYTVLDMDGKPSDAVISVDENGLITAKDNGDAIVLVSYDAINIAYAPNDAENSSNGVGSYAANGFYSALWPENTGVFVVSVGAGDSGIDPGTTIARPSESRAIDFEYDVIYFTGSNGTYTFTPATSGVTVSVANPKVDNYDVCNSLHMGGFKEVSANANGSYDVPLTDGRNVLKLEKDGKAEYQVISAKKTNVTVNGMPLESCGVCAGDKISIKFDTLFNPMNRNQYFNGDVAPIYRSISGLPGKLAGTTRGPYGYYFFPASEYKHTIENFVLETDDGSQYKNPVVSKDGDLTVPADFTGDVFTLTDGSFNMAGFGNPGKQRSDLGGFINPDAQSGDNEISVQADLAPSASDYLAKLPDLSIPVVTLDSISISKQPTKKTYKLNEDFNSEGMIVTAHYSNGSTQDVTDYTCSTLDSAAAGEKTVTISYTRGGVTKTTDVTVKVTDTEITSLEITSQPTKTLYFVNEEFDPTGMVVLAHYSNGTEGELESGEYTVTPNIFDNSAAKVSVAVSAGGQTVTVPITVKLIVKMELAKELKKTEFTAGEKLGAVSVKLTYGDETTRNANTASAVMGMRSSPYLRKLTTYDDQISIIATGNCVPATQKKNYTPVADLEPLIVPIKVTDENPGAPITVYASCDNKGTWLIGKDGTELYNVPLTVYDLDKDGKYTITDALVTLHHLYCPDGASGFDTNGSMMYRFWNYVNPGVTYSRNNELAANAAVELTDGDTITAHINKSDADLYTSFDSASYSAATGEREIFQVNGQTRDKTAAAPNGATVTVYNSDGEKQDNLTTTVDKDGYFAIRFPAAGTYTVEISGVCSYTNAKNTLIGDAVVIPSRCTIEVTDDSSEPKNSITAYITYSNKGELATSGNTLLYKVPVEVYDTNEDGKFTVSEAFQAFHKEYYSAGINGYSDDANTGWINKFWGKDGSTLSYTLNNGWVFGAQTEIKDKDSLSAFHYNDGTNYADLYTWFLPENDQARAQVGKTFTVNGMNVMNSNATMISRAVPVGATITVYDQNGEEMTDLATVTDAKGQFSITFPKVGKYTVEASGTCDYTCIAYDGSAGQHYDNAALIPSRCTVTVVSNSSGGSSGGTTTGGGTGTVSNDQKAANTVIGLISAIGTVTKDSGDKITAARAAYDKLTDAQKKLVTNYGTLTDAEAAFANLGKGELPFTDINGHWAYDAIKYAYKNSLFAGTSATTFGPNVSMNRAMLVTVLYRLDKEPSAEAVSSFKDVPAGQWYTKAVAWASANKIVSGYSADTFGPTDTITREQMASILYRYAQYKGYDVSKTTDLAAFTDKASVSDWALTSMQWANAEKLINGRTAATLVPQGNATRAEVAQILMTFSETVAK